MLYLKLNCYSLKIKSCFCDFKRDKLYTRTVSKLRPKSASLSPQQAGHGTGVALAMLLWQKWCCVDAPFIKLFPHLHRHDNGAVLQHLQNKSDLEHTGLAKQTSSTRRGRHHRCAKPPVQSPGPADTCSTSPVWYHAVLGQGTRPFPCADRTSIPPVCSWMWLETEGPPTAQQVCRSLG